MIVILVEITIVLWLVGWAIMCGLLWLIGVDSGLIDGNQLFDAIYYIFVIATRFFPLNHFICIICDERLIWLIEVLDGLYNCLRDFSYPRYSLKNILTRYQINHFVVLRPGIFFIQNLWKESFDPNQVITYNSNLF